MNKLIERLQKPDFPVLFRQSDLSNLEFDKIELKELFDNSVRKYYINHIYKDIYTLARMYRRELVDEAVLAQMIVPDSYASLLYVLSINSWIPEAAYSVSSAVVGKEVSVDTDKFGSFFYYGICDRLILNGVHKINNKSGICLKATPIKALCDYVCMFNHSWKGINAANDYLRVKYYKMEELKQEDFDEIQGSYKIKNVEVFIESLRKDLKI
jgi:hypothetical protein